MGENKEMKRKKGVIIALDFPDNWATYGFLEAFRHLEEKPFVKVGMELFYKEGPSIVKGLKMQGYPVFLDLKLHDIPNTVKMAMKNIAKMGVDMTNVHVSGTTAMMEAAMEGLSEGAAEAEIDRPVLVAVTQLTSTGEDVMKQDLLIDASMEEVIAHYGENAKKAGLDGVVCSPLEAPLIHEKLGQDFLTVTPGVRFEGEDTQDQARVTTPEKAKELGSDFIVMGRSVTKAESPLLAYQRAAGAFR